MPKKIIIAAAFSLLATAGSASEAAKKNLVAHDTTSPMTCSCASEAATAPKEAPKTDKVTKVAVKQPKAQSNIDLHPEDYR